MYTYENHMMHDAWYFVDDRTNIVHMFHLAEPLDGGPSFVGHAISHDLVTWERLPTALHVGPPGSWDDLRLCTGSVIERDGRYRMAYSATGHEDSTIEEQYRVQRAGMAVSDDLIDLDEAARKPRDRGRRSPTTSEWAPASVRCTTGATHSCSTMARLSTNWFAPAGTKVPLVSEVPSRWPAVPM